MLFKFRTINVCIKLFMHQHCNSVENRFSVIVQMLFLDYKLIVHVIADGNLPATLMTDLSK